MKNKDVNQQGRRGTAKKNQKNHRIHSESSEEIKLPRKIKRTSRHQI